jgi:hypothetical protein
MCEVTREFLIGVDGLTLYVHGACAPEIRDFLQGSPPIGQIGTESYAVIHDLEPCAADKLDHFDEIIIQPIVDFFDAYGKLGDRFTEILLRDSDDDE